MSISAEAGPEASRAGAVRGAGGLYVFLLVELCVSVASMIYFQFLMRPSTFLGSESFELSLRLQEGVWLVFGAVGLALLVPFVLGRRGTRAQGVSRAALALGALNLVLHLLRASEHIGGPALLAFDGSADTERLFSAGLYGGFVAYEICFWLAITRSAARLPQGFAPAFYTLLGLTTAIALSHLLLPPETYYEVFLSGALASLLPWLRLVLGSARMLLPILVLRRLTRGGAEPSSESAGAPEGTAPSATRDLVVGGIWLAGGTLVTVASYTGASAGGRYLVATGAIVYGIVRVVRGLVRSGSGAAES